MTLAGAATIKKLYFFKFRNMYVHGANFEKLPWFSGLTHEFMNFMALSTGLKLSKFTHHCFRGSKDSTWRFQILNFNWHTRVCSICGKPQVWGSLCGQFSLPWSKQQARSRNLEKYIRLEFCLDYHLRWQRGSIQLKVSKSYLLIWSFEYEFNLQISDGSMHHVVGVFILLILNIEKETCGVWDWPIDKRWIHCKLTSANLWSGKFHPKIGVILQLKLWVKTARNLRWETSLTISRCCGKKSRGYSSNRLWLRVRKIPWMRWKLCLFPVYFHSNFFSRSQDCLQV